jgi:hypothetical protein
MRALKSLALATIAIGSFGAGWYWHQYRLLEGPRYVLTQPLELGVTTSGNGKLPAGAVLYHFRDLPEISTFVLFVNTKRLDALKLDQRNKDKSFLIDPVEAF